MLDLAWLVPLLAYLGAAVWAYLDLARQGQAGVFWAALTPLVIVGRFIGRLIKKDF